jgi:AraC family transcriptional activator of pobA
MGVAGDPRSGTLQAGSNGSTAERENGAEAFSVPVYGLFGEAATGVGYGFLHVEPLAVRNEPNAWHISPHLHPNLEQISLVLSGDCAFDMNNVSLQAKESSVVYMPANTVHAFHYEASAKGFIISLSRDFLNGMTRSNPLLAAAYQRLSNCRGAALTGDTRRLEMLCSMLVDYSRQGSGSASLEASYLFYHLWLLLDRVVRPEGMGRGEEDDAKEFDLFDRLRSTIEEHFRYGLNDQMTGDIHQKRRTAEYFATLLNVSLFQLNRCAQRAVGNSVSELIKEALLAEATRLLLYTNIPVKDVSDFLGYSNSSHFIRFFKREVGTAPDAFRSANTMFTRPRENETNFDRIGD